MMFLFRFPLASAASPATPAPNGTFLEFIDKTFTNHFPLAYSHFEQPNTHLRQALETFVGVIMANRAVATHTSHNMTTSTNDQNDITSSPLHFTTTSSHSTCTLSASDTLAMRALTNEVAESREKMVLLNVQIVKLTEDLRKTRTAMQGGPPARLHQSTSDGTLLGTHAVESTGIPSGTHVQSDGIPPGTQSGIPPGTHVQSDGIPPGTHSIIPFIHTTMSTTSADNIITYEMLSRMRFPKMASIDDVLSVYYNGHPNIIIGPMKQWPHNVLTHRPFGQTISKMNRAVALYESTPPCEREAMFFTIDPHSNSRKPLCLEAIFTKLLRRSRTK